MTVKELIEELNKYPHEAEVCYLGQEQGLIRIASVKEITPADEETKEIVEIAGVKLLLLE